MIGRLLGTAATLLVYFCAATLIAEVVILAYVGSTWHVDQEKLLRMVAIARGIEPAAPPDKQASPEAVGPEQASYQEILERRAVKLRDLELREQSLASALAELKSEQEALAKSRQEEQARIAQFQSQLKAFQEGAQSSGRETLRRTLETLKPKQAKEQLFEMLQSNNVDEVVMLLAGMTESRRAKILAEFKTPEENKKLAEVLRRIGEGKPEASLAEQAQKPLPGMIPTGP